MRAETLAALHARCFVHPRPWSAAEFAVLLADPGALLVWQPVAGSGPTAARQAPAPDALAGFAMARQIAGEAELLTLAVDPAARRQGVARALLGRLFARAAQAGALRMFLEVAEDNDPARALYAATGFAPVGRRRGYYLRADGGRVDALVLARALSGAN